MGWGVVELDVVRIFQVSPQNKTIEIMSELESFLSGLGSFEIILGSFEIP